ncbi:facilitated trehalose transporter Tret1-2 homolog [Aricia agestis]|uniref:facilitated trehalose transporter Tret1-2 homolog n=1 Tax=Aricia agestis TaxID=91739 RepID=UPI001C2070A3|nr:facilitated trehalose transporter Tret1-2 homolog [Aricia agestis]
MTKSDKNEKDIVVLKSVVKNECNEVKEVKNERDSITKISDDKTNEKLNPDSHTVAKFSPLCRQTLSSLGAITMTIASGLTIGFSATLLPQLKETHNNILTSQEAGSWIASIAALSMVPTCVVGGSIIEKFGRRNTHFIISVPFFLAWMIIALADNLPLVLLGRFLTGGCAGFTGPLGSVFISETTSPVYRGLFLSVISLAIAIGIFFTHCIGTWVHWQWAAMICGLVPILSALLLAFVPESPVWLISKQKVEEGVKSFHWYRGYDEEAKLELSSIIEKYKSQSIEQPPTYIEMWKSVEFLKPLFIMFVFFGTVNFAGTNVFAFYSVEIIEKAVGKGVDNYLAMIVIDTIRLIMSTIACYVCKRYNRRLLCMVSGLFTGVAMLLLSLFLNFASDRSEMALIPLSCLLLYICSLSIGLIPLPWIMCAEIFPTKYRGQGSGVSAAIGFAASFVVVKIAPAMFSSFGNIISFFIYGVLCLIGTGILYFILPETNRRTLQEIEDGIQKKSNSP